MIRLGDRVLYQNQEWDVWSAAPRVAGVVRWWLVADDGTTRVMAREDELTPVQPELDLFSGGDGAA